MNQPAENAITTTHHNTSGPANPFAKQLDSSVNAGAVAIEAERAIAEAQGMLVVAKRFPRDQAAAFASVMEACGRRGLAESAVYSFPRGNETVSGPSIRLAEELARAWGNLSYGIRELSQRQGVSEMEAFCWDLETNVISSQKFAVKHERDKRGGATKLTDQRDIYELTANLGARRLRARILAILPPDLVDAAVAKCSETLGRNDTKPADPARLKKMVEAFGKLGVSDALIERRLGHPISTTTGGELSEYLGIYNSIKDANTGAADWFDVPREQVKASMADLNAQVLAGAQPAAAPAANDNAQAPPKEDKPNAAPFV